MDIEFATLEVGGRERDVLMTAPKDGFFYVLARRTGKLLSAEKWAEIVNWAERVDLASGRPVENPAARFPSGSGFLMYPGGNLGAHSTQPMAYSPESKLVYIPETILARYYTNDGVNLNNWTFKPGFAYNEGLGKTPPTQKIPPARGALVAWDPIRAKRAWTIPLEGPINGGVMATGGNIVVQGRADGNFVIYAGQTGQELWRFFAQAGIAGQPITYLSGGKQCITVIVGIGGVAGVARPELGWEYRSQKRRVLTFVLGGKETLPEFKPHVKQFRDDPAFSVDVTKAEVGQLLYNQQCVTCHGGALRAGGAAPDLRESPIPLHLEAMKAVLQRGLLEVNGMPKFAEFTSAQVQAIQHFIRKDAREALHEQKAAKQ